MNLLLFNLATDADDPVLGFTTVWIQALAPHCKTIHVLTMRQGRLDLPDNVYVYSVGKEKGYSEPRRAIKFYRHLTRILANHRIDACFAHMMPLFAVMGAPLLKAKRIPVTLWYTHKSVTLLLRVAERLVDRVVTASAESFRIPSRKVIVTGHGIDTNHFVPATNTTNGRPFTIACIGRLSPIKRVEVLLEATNYLVRDYGMNDLCVRIVGDATGERDRDYAKSLRDQAIKLGLTEVVQFTGAIPFAQIVKEYQQADVVIHLCDSGLDKVVLESMSCAVPVITSNISFRNVLGSLAETCMIPKNNPSNLANQIYALYQQPKETRRGLGQQLREIVVREHSLDNLASRLVERIFFIS